MLVVSSKYNIEQDDFTEWINPSNHLTSLKQSALIQKPSAQTPFKTLISMK